MRKLLIIPLVIAVCLVIAYAQTKVQVQSFMQIGDAAIVTHVQAPALKNSTNTAATNTAVTASIAAVAGTSVKLYALEAYCSAGTATVTIKDGVGGSSVWTTPAAASTSRTFYTPFSSSYGNGMDIVLATCGSGNTGVLNIQASQF